VSDLSDRIEALAQRGAQFRAGGKWLVVIGLCLSGTLLALGWPDPADHMALNSYVSVPEPLFSFLKQRGAGVRDTVSWLLDPNPFGWRSTLYLPGLFAGYALLKRLIPSRGVRIAVIVIAVLTSPIWVSMVVPRSETINSPGARTGIVVDHPGAPAAHADGTSRPPVPAYLLVPAALPQPLADQARFALAQQAYLDNDPVRMGRHLTGLTGQWRPTGGDRDILGLMVEHAAAVGRPVAGIAPVLTGGAPHSAWRLAAYAIVKWLSIACIGAGALFFLLGVRRRDQAETQAGRLARVAEPAPAASTATSPSFGRRRPVATTSP
jgi:hypothetical protein